MFKKMAGMLAKKTLFLIFAVVLLYVYYGFKGALLFSACALLDFKRLPIYLKCLPREIRFFLSVITGIIYLKKDENKTLGELFARVVEKYPNKTAIIEAENGRKLTFKEFQELSNKISNIFHDAGYGDGDNVALFMPNVIEFMPLYIGLSNIGVSSVFINTNLKGNSLRHALNVIKLKAVLYHADLKLSLDDVGTWNDEAAPKMFVLGCQSENNTEDIKIETLLENASATAPVKVNFKSSPDFPVSYIFTSGTTGHPKPAVMARKKFLAGFLIFKHLTEISPDDVVYNTLPMYHTSGSIIFFAGTFLCGCTMVIRRKFSGSNFLSDCIKYNVTYAGYIGEMMRYLLSQPPSENDRSHTIRKICGNGLRRSLFPVLKERFNFPLIYEFYGATEANFGFINNDNTEGAVGFLFVCFPFLNLKRLVKVNPATGELLKDSDNLPIECEPGQHGTLISVINSSQPYYGYINKEDSKKKVASDVYKKGDRYFLSGDLLVTDEHGYLYFVDRLGDTFRWKGENVSTIEVENVISTSFLYFIHCIVYPVQIPGHEGNAGMAYLMFEEKVQLVDINETLKAWQENLPKYALPIFIRIGNSLQVTGTYKYQKETLKKEAFNLQCCQEGESIFVINDSKTGYEQMTAVVYEDITQGVRKF